MTGWALVSGNKDLQHFAAKRMSDNLRTFVIAGKW